MFTIEGPSLYIDLDTLIVGDLSDIERQAHENEFTALRDFYRYAGIGSGLMAWNISMRHFYTEFAASPEKFMQTCRHGGDQKFIENRAYNVTRWQDKLPGQVVSYKADKCADGKPSNARVVCLHGVPKFTDMPVGNWARSMWEHAA